MKPAKLITSSNDMYMDGYLKSELDVVTKEAIPNKWDCISIYFGGEGSGKSTISAQNALYVDKNFGLKQVVFTPSQFEESLETCKDESAIDFDEAITAANASLYAQLISISIISKLTQIRKKRLKIFLNFPYLHMLHDYFIKRCLFGIHVYAHDFNDRGYFRFYSQPRMESLYWLMKEKYRFNNRRAFKDVMPNFYGRFSKGLPFSEAEYDEKKEWSRKHARNDFIIWRERFIKTLNMIKNDTKLPISQVATGLKISKQFLYQLMKEQ